ncbi:restriction endonuclease subunit S [Photobacterium damselae]|uniref:restriction endonuclease subunit S n=1 Tax=Photobacterium damselae TaxID=38293 RepID=UPI0010FD6636|nr:restriction endonuclease subunit S [Photobacterium damselae]TLS65438.1 restriction endonuclease subunit S [Photobacterium damselae subsp. damselae]
MSKYQAYPKYAPSGNEFVGIIPVGWERCTVDSVSNVIDPQPDHRAPEICHNGEGFPYIGIRDVKRDGTLNFETARPVKESAVIKQEKSFAIELNDIIFCKVGTLGLPRKLIPHGRCALSATLVLIKTKPNYISQFLLYALDSCVVTSQTDYLATGSTRAALGIQQIRRFQIPKPTISEQTTIAAFLDHETAKIDTLIEKQQQLIELLKEKRQAVISHAVTKGLNPDAPMKDSGVEWLGEVPEHWDVCLFKYKCNEVTDGAHISPDLNDGAHYFVSIKDIKNGIINFDNALLTSSKSYDYLVKTGCMPFAGDILFSKDGTIGQTAITPSEIDFVVASSLIIIRPNRQQVVSEYLDFLLQSSLVQEQVESFIKGAALRRLSIQNLLKIFGVFPSLGEQKEIAVYIKNQLKKYSDLMIQANSQVKLLQERRTALISAAVTGKIDVRHWIAPTTSSDTNKAQQEVTA